MPRKQILLIGTGGTIASEMTDSGLAPGLQTDQLLSFVPAISDICQADCLQLLSMDSTNIAPSHWLQMARCIQEHYDCYDGFVLTHGTDTMAYTAAALSYLIQGSPKPIVLTGPSALTPLTPKPTCLTPSAVHRRTSPAYPSFSTAR